MKSPWIAISIGMTLGGLLPTFWGVSEISFTSLIFTGIGAFVGLWVYNYMD